MTSEAHVTEDGSSDANLQYVLRHSTSKLTWSERMDFSDTQTYIVSDLGPLKRFLNQGLNLRIEEEKVLSWPAVPEDITMAKPSRTVKEKKGKKGKECPIKSGSTKDQKTKDKKKKSVPELVQDSPIRRILGSAHVPLQSLVKRGQKVIVLCDFGALYTESELETLEKNLGKKITEDKKKEEKESKRRGGSGTRQKNTAASKGKGKGRNEGKMDVLTDNSVSAPLGPVTVEVTVELEKWQSASEAHQLLLPDQKS